MKIPKIGKKPLIITLVAVAVVTVLTIGTVAYLKHTTVARVSDSSNTELQKTETTQEAPTAETAPVVEETAPAPAAQQAPVQAPEEPVTPPVDQSEQNKAIAQQAMLEFNVARGYPTGGGWSSAESQWICMERILTREGIGFSNLDAVMAYINKHYIVGDRDPNLEGNQRYFFDGPGTCNIMQYTR